MKKLTKNSARLVLQKETVRAIATEQLHQALGAAPQTTGGGGGTISSQGAPCTISRTCSTIIP